MKLSVLPGGWTLSWYQTEIVNSLHSVSIRQLGGVGRFNCLDRMNSVMETLLSLCVCVCFLCLYLIWVVADRKGWWVGIKPERCGEACKMKPRTWPLSICFMECDRCYSAGVPCFLCFLQGCQWYLENACVGSLDLFSRVTNKFDLFGLECKVLATIRWIAMKFVDPPWRWPVNPLTFESALSWSLNDLHVHVCATVSSCWFNPVLLIILDPESLFSCL